MTEESKVRQQVEFYFSDSNLRRDNFLKAAIAADTEHFVPIATLLTFNRLKALTTDAEYIAEALKSSNVVEVSSCGSKVRRTSELNPIDTSKDRTVYIKGYPIDDPSVTIEEIARIFSEHGKVLMVRLRKDQNGAFKGSCFVEFESEDGMKAAVAAAHSDGQVVMKFKETPLACVLTLSGWLQRRRDRRASAHKKAKGESAEAKAGDGDAAVGTKRGRDDEKDVKEEHEEKKFEYTSGLILKVGNLPAEATLFQVKDFFKALGEVKYVEFKTGDSDAYVRFASLQAIDTVKTVLEKGISLVAGGTHMSCSIVAGDDEVEYYKKIEEASKMKSGPGGRGGGGRGGRGKGKGGRGFKKSKRS